MTNGEATRDAIRAKNKEQLGIIVDRWRHSYSNTIGCFPIYFAAFYEMFFYVINWTPERLNFTLDLMEERTLAKEILPFSPLGWTLDDNEYCIKALYEEIEKDRYGVPLFNIFSLFWMRCGGSSVTHFWSGWHKNLYERFPRGFFDLCDIARNKESQEITAISNLKSGWAE